MILAGDIGGTKTVVALFQEEGEGLHLVRDATFQSKDHTSLEDIASAFLQANPVPVHAGCFGVAGPVVAGAVRTTNLPWHLDEPGIAAAIGAPKVKLLNDLEAAAYGMLHLRPEEFAALNPAAAPARQGNVAVIAAGTGLGEAILHWDGHQHLPMASEGGHADFSPRTDLEIDLLRYLRDRQGGHVSWERVLSGPGFHKVYSFLRDRGDFPEPPALADQLRAAPDPSAVITQTGLAGHDPLCVATLDLFATLYGVEAGNLALKCLAVGGVFIGGGIAPKMLPALERGGFLLAFTDKGRLRTFLKTLEVRVALNPRAPLIGAAYFALRLAREERSKPPAQSPPRP
jgi:glucokinase